MPFSRRVSATPVKPRARRSFFDFGWGAKNKVNVADEGSKQDLTAETKSNDSQERPDTAAERREKLRQASRLRLTTKDAIVNDDNTAVRVDHPDGRANAIPGPRDRLM